MNRFKFRIIVDGRIINDVTGFVVDQNKEKIRIFRMNPDMRDGMSSELFLLKDVIIEQCTGAKEKNGDLIYDGDVAKNVHPRSSLKCGWNKSQHRWSWYWIGTDDIYCHLGQGDSDPEIVGNMHTAGEATECPR